LALAVGVFFWMEIRYHGQLAHEARRLMLSNLLIPSWGAGTLREVWLSSGRSDRQILEEILVAHRQALEAGQADQFEHAVIDSGVYEHWLQQLRAGSVRRRVTAATRLGHFHDRRGVQALVAAAQDPSPQVELAVALSLGRLKDPAGLRALVALAKKSRSAIPDLTLTGALAACAESPAARLVSLLEGPADRTRVIGAWALSEVSDLTVLPQLRRAAQDPEPEVRAKVARALARIPGRESVEALRLLAHDPVWFVRLRAFDALGKLSDRVGEAMALAGLADEVREVRYHAAYALRQIAGMKAEVAMRVLVTRSRRDFNSLLSEWERAGFLWQVAGGLSARDPKRFQESCEFLRALIAAGFTRALRNFVLVFPELKVRLRLVRLLAEAASPQVRRDLRAVVGKPACDRRVAAAICARLADAGEAVSAGAGSFAA